VNDHGLSGFQLQEIVDPLQRGESGGCDRTGLLHRQLHRHMPDTLGGNRHVLGVETALGVIPTVGIDVLAHLEAVHTRAQRDDRSGPSVPSTSGKAEC